MEPVRVSKRTAKIDTAEDSSPTLNEDDMETLYAAALRYSGALACYVKNDQIVLTWLLTLVLSTHRTMLAAEPTPRVRFTIPRQEVVDGRISEDGETLLIADPAVSVREFELSLRELRGCTSFLYAYAPPNVYDIEIDLPALRNAMYGADGVVHV